MSDDCMWRTADEAGDSDWPDAHFKQWEYISADVVEGWLEQFPEARKYVSSVEADVDEDEAAYIDERDRLARKEPRE